VQIGGCRHVGFTFPHIGNTGVNPEDDETADPVASGMIVKWDPTDASNWRSTEELTDWLARRGRIGMGGVDTRRLTRAIRQQGAPHVAIAHDPDGKFDIEALVAKARAFVGLEGLDLAKDVTCAQSYHWKKTYWPLTLMACFCRTARVIPPRQVNTRCL